MDVIEKFLKRVSYKFPKGYPDINDKQDQALLEEILQSYLGEEYKFNPLKYGDIARGGQAYAGRTFKIWDKIDKGEEFETVNGNVKLEFAKDEYAELFKNEDVATIKKFANKINSFPFFKDNSGKKYSLNDLVKNKDFGGAGKGRAEEKENIALAGITRTIKELVANKGPLTVVLKKGGKEYEGIIGATTVGKFPKADFTLDSKDGPVMFISHKAGSTAKQFQQYGGFEGLEKYPEIQEFIEAVRKKTEETGGELTTSYQRAFTNKEISRKAIYGVDYQQGTSGLNNIDVILQGNLTLTSLDDDTYLLDAVHKVVKDDESNIPTGDYTPYLGVRISKDRNNFGIKYARFMVWPGGGRGANAEII